MAIDASKLPYMEVQIQLQILEHIAQKGPLEGGDLELERQLEARDHELVQTKLIESFDAAPHSKDGLDNNDAWKKAAEYPEFRSKAENIARRHLQEEAELSPTWPKRINNGQRTVMRSNVQKTSFAKRKIE